MSGRLGGLSGQPTQGFSGNYVVCASSGYFNAGGVANSARLDGMLFAVSTVKLTDATDGTTNTALVSELLLVEDDDSHDIRGRYYNPAHSGVSFSTRLPPNAPVPDQFNWCSPQPVPRAPCTWTGTNVFVLPRSYHPGGVNAGLADGSVRFIAENIDAATFRALGSRNGDEVSGPY